MNLQQLRHVVALADHGTMTRAAAMLEVSQPALTRSVRALERELGVVLVERVGRGVQLTEVGDTVVGAARRALVEVDQIASVGALHACRVATTETQAKELCVPAISQVMLQAAHGMSLITVDSPTEVADLVRSGRADIGVCDLRAVTLPEAVELGVQETFLLCPAGWEVSTPLTRAAFEAMPLVAPVARSRRRDQFERALGSAEISPQVVTEVDRIEHGVPLVLAGRAATFIYRRAAAAAVAQGAQLVRLEPPLRRKVGYLCRPGPLPDAVNRFVEALWIEAASVLDPIEDAPPEG